MLNYLLHVNYLTPMRNEKKEKQNKPKRMSVIPMLT